MSESVQDGSLHTSSATGWDVDKAVQQPDKKSVLDSWIHSAVGLAWHGESETRTEVEHYAGELAKTLPLFLGGRVGLIASTVSYALAEAKTGDSFSSQVLEGIAGGLKGNLTKRSFEYFGNKEWGVLSKGLTLGASSRLLDTGLTPDTYFKNGKFDPVGGLSDALTNTGSLSAAGIDAATWLIAPKLGTVFAKGLTGSRQQLVGQFVPAMFGFTSGSLAEMQRQSQAHEDFSWTKIAGRGVAEGAVMGLAGSMAAPINQSFHLAPVFRGSETASAMPPHVEPSSQPLGSTLRSAAEVLLPPMAIAEPALAMAGIGELPMNAQTLHMSEATRSTGDTTVVERELIKPQPGDSYRAQAGDHVQAGNDTVVVAPKGSVVQALRGSWVFAEEGSIIHAEEGAWVHAEAGSLVHANFGSQIFAEANSVVNANHGSHVEALQGSEIHAGDGSFVHARGAAVYAARGSNVYAYGSNSQHRAGTVHVAEGANVTAEADREKYESRSGGSDPGRKAPNVNLAEGARVNWEKRYFGDNLEASWKAAMSEKGREYLAEQGRHNDWQQDWSEGRRDVVPTPRPDKPTLVIVDMQERYIGKRVPSNFKAIADAVQYAKKNGWGVAVLEMQYGRTHTPLINLLKSYDGFDFTVKEREDGSRELRDLLAKDQFGASNLMVMGMYGDNCVLATVRGLGKVLPNATVHVIKDATYTSHPYDWRDYFQEHFDRENNTMVRTNQLLHPNLVLRNTLADAT
jgi:nicotinamidase-related amidase